MCGTTLSAGAEGASLFDAASVSRLTAGSVNGYIYLRLVDGCDKGADYSISPPSAAVVVKAAPAGDHRAAAIVLRPLKDVFNVQVTADGSAPVVVRVRLNTAPSSGPDVYTR
ncbi:MAG: hypothetical protein DLM56_09865 [Pseudonocardiales bacterium]|nr:MAG: hypothetical protein DLM56_09865 [Pseudonocardiales bacterium]